MLKEKAKLKQQILEMKRTYNEFLDSLIYEIENDNIPTQKMIDRADPEKLVNKIRTSVFSEYDFQIKVTEYLKMIGVPAHFDGYNFLRDAIIICLREKTLPSPTKELYPKIAEKYKKKPTQVERSIRNAIETVWNAGNQDLLHEFFGGYDFILQSRKPTNSEFIATVADKIRMDCIKDLGI